MAVFDSVAGVEPQSETVWRQANKYKVPRLCFMNKMDRMGANFSRAVRMVRDQLGTVPLLLHLPIGSESNFAGIIDLVANKAVVWNSESLGAKFESFSLDDKDIRTLVPSLSDELLSLAAAKREEMIELAIEQDEEIMLEYLESGKFPSIDALKRCIRLGTLSFSFTPILAGSAFKNKGVQCLLDAIVDYLPSPLDRPPVKTIPFRGANTVIDDDEGCNTNTKARSIELKARDDAPLTALAFKIFNDPFVGTLTFVRVFSGILRSGMNVNNVGKEKTEKIGRMLQVRQSSIFTNYSWH